MSMIENLNDQLFKTIREHDEEENINYESCIKTYVIIDAARIKKLTNELIALISLNYENLFMPHEQESLEEVAPYLVELKKEDDFTQWVYENVYGKQGAIFIHSSKNIEELAEHFRPYITSTIKMPNPKNETELIETEAYMRLYDPRVFPLFNKQVKQKQKQFYSPLKSIYVENPQNEEELLFYSQYKETILNLKEL